MKKGIFLIVVVLFFAVSLSAQESMEGRRTSKSFYEELVVNNTTEVRKPAVLPYIDPADILWAKTLWRELNLREKMNLPLYYPVTPSEGRISLIDLLIKGIKDKGKAAYEAGPTVTNEFGTILDYGSIAAGLGGGTDTLYSDDGREPIYLEKEVHTDEIKTLLIKEIWYFNKKTSRMEVRIVGLCPVRVYKEAEDSEEMPMRKRQLFWVDYEEFRDLFAAQKVLIGGDITTAVTYDDLFLKRRFSSRIIQESNVNGQKISSYTTDNPLDAILESDRIETELFNREQDLWEY